MRIINASPTENVIFTWEATAQGETPESVTYTYTVGETGKVKIGNLLESGQIVVNMILSKMF